MVEERSHDIEVRESTPEDVVLAEPASRLIALVAETFDIATRTPDWLATKLRSRRAAIALDGRDLVGFGYWSSWEGDRFVSHSGLVVHPDRFKIGLGQRLKEVVFASSQRQLPEATMMSLTSSPQVRRMNERLGFRVVALTELTHDAAFWKGCETCRNFADVQARGERCCCEGMIRPPGGWGSK